MTATAWTHGPSDDVELRSSTHRSVWDYFPRVVTGLLLEPDGYRSWRTVRDGSARTHIDWRRNRLAAIAAEAAVWARQDIGDPRVEWFARVRRMLGTDIASSDPKDLAVALFAANVASHAEHVTEHNVESLRSLGLTDEQIVDIALAAATSSFFADAALEALIARRQQAPAIPRPRTPTA
jgi:hypothetical protein